MKKTFIALLLLAAGSAFAAKPVTIKGSDTMVIMNAKLAETFMRKNPEAQIQVTGGGSGVGLAALINGTTDIAAASRPIKSTEVDKLKARFATLGVGIAIARDGLAIYLNAANPVQELSLAQLRDIYTGRITNWKDVGGKDAPIILYSRENSSGTYTYFKDNVLMGKDYSPRAQTLQGTAAVVNAVSKDVNGIGYGGSAYAKGVHFAKVRKDDKSAAYVPTLETVRAGQYPISRYLYLYLRAAPNGDAKRFIDWCLSAEGQKVVTDVGYFPVK
ncbi:MAG: phosphate ABC transporter substrate-binding protein [Acidobacteria bacterium]|nr:phosphate ABC transporter substrate-binding protein [Acidobacteriota bacterium]MBV9475360.1 phosphate ABC transporter substrate-binding protein [Acidobacteriota bacterium]